MTRTILQDIVDDISFDSLPANWSAFDIESFSRTKALWDYQRRAVEGAVKVLWKYFEDLEDYKQAEGTDANRERKTKLYRWYESNGLADNLDLNISRDDQLSEMLGEYYEVDDGAVSYRQLINRASFWMATGSGKTLVLVKLIEILRDLIERGEIPNHDILILSSRDDLIEQLLEHINEFNAARGDIFIHARELREYADAKRHHTSLFHKDELTVFYYRSDNMSDIQKQLIIDFRNYDNDGQWYVLLDEAHKGDREESKRQHIYSILSRNGFLFNFSATFTDVRDFATTVSNFNLSEFIAAGYGKHIALFQQELRPFQDNEDFAREEKQKIVLKSLIMLAYARRFADRVRRIRGAHYHRPLLLTLVNSVNTEDADLKLFFHELERIGRGDIDPAVWSASKSELWEELRDRPPLMFEKERHFTADRPTFRRLDRRAILKTVFNSSSPGEIEVLIRPSNKQELAFKLKTSDAPFALIKIGDISGWLREQLVGYEVVEGFDDEGFFESLNTESSSINVLMGSRAFYEGWDSNRPNVVNFINIGVGVEAKKFILQAVGRGVRIEPIENQRKRLIHVYNSGDLEQDLFDQIRDIVAPVETLIIFGTNRQALLTVISQLQQESRKGEYHQLALFRNPTSVHHELLIPAYRSAEKPLVEDSTGARFEIADSELALVTNYIRFIGDKRVLMARHNADLQRVRILEESIAAPKLFYKPSSSLYRNIDLLVERILEYFSLVPQDFDHLKELEDEIRHFENIRVSLKEVGNLRSKVESVAAYEDPNTAKKQLRSQLDKGEIDIDAYTAGIEAAARMVREVNASYHNKRLRIRHVANHFYVPMIISGEKERIDFIKHIIQEDSEILFLNHLEEYLARPNLLDELDWWMFSKLDENLDDVYVPYYDGTANKIREFKPDFIFWLQKAKDYFIVFIDPKGTEHSAYQRKVDGFSALFEEPGGLKRVLRHKGKRVEVSLLLHTPDIDGLAEGYSAYWFDEIHEAFASVLPDD